MCNPNWRGSTYRSTFYAALSMGDRLTCVDARAPTSRIGSDATLMACAACNHNSETFTVFGTRAYISIRADAAGLMAEDCELISIAERLSSVFF